jgi:hypothetical protein
MTIHDDDLGGRLRLRNPADLPAAQKQIYDRLNTGMIQWAETIPFRSTTSGGRLIGPYNPMLLSPNTTIVKRIPNMIVVPAHDQRAFADMAELPNVTTKGLIL